MLFVLDRSALWEVTERRFETVSARRRWSEQALQSALSGMLWLLLVLLWEEEQEMCVPGCCVRELGLRARGSVSSRKKVNTICIQETNQD